MRVNTGAHYCFFSSLTPPSQKRSVSHEGLAITISARQHIVVCVFKARWRKVAVNYWLMVELHIPDLTCLQSLRRRRLWLCEYRLSTKRARTILQRNKAVLNARFSLQGSLHKHIPLSIHQHFPVTKINRLEAYAISVLSCPNTPNTE